MTIDELVAHAHGMAVDKGWHDGASGCKDDRVDRIPTLMMMVVTEAAEAVETYRSGEMAAWVGTGGKPEGFDSELADIIIRVADIAGLYGVDLGKAIVEKMAYNSTRAHRHGGKAC